MKKLLYLFFLVSAFTSFKQKELTWVAIGDSITYLNNHPDETGDRVKKGYLDRVADLLPNVHYINQGYNGWTVIRIARNIDSLRLGSADVFSIFLGTNDWWAGNDPGTLNDYINNTGNKTVYGAFRTIINKLRSLNPKATIIMVTPMQRADFVYIGGMKNNAFGSYKEKNGRMLSDFVRVVTGIAKHEHFKVVDLYHAKGMAIKDMVAFKRLKDPATGQYKNYTYPDYIKIPFNPDTDEYPYPVEAIGVTYDGLHPSDKGNEMIAKMLVKVMPK
jgi:lysophospholipase L1-like esterase